MADKTKTKDKPKTPELDLSKLAPVAAELPKVSRDKRDNPFTPWLRESNDGRDAGKEGKGKRVTVPAVNVGEVEYLIRKAATELGIGARVVIQNTKGETVTKDQTKGIAAKNRAAQVHVLFSAKDRKSRKTKDTDAAAPATPAPATAAS